MTLDKIEDKEDTYQFSFNGWRISCDVYAKEKIIFSGGMNDEVIILKVKDNQAVYSDDRREFEEGYSLHHEGEERCKVYFEFNEYSVKVKTRACSLVYGGFRVSFEGLYN